MMRNIAIVFLAAILLGCIGQDGKMVKPTETGLVLSDYPELFGKDVVIVIGNNASQIEIEGVDAIVENLFNLTGNMPVIKTDAEITEDELARHNLIVVGGADSNEILAEVYDMTDAMGVTDVYPGAGKGVLEILRNPWGKGKAMLLVAGIDEWGVKAGSEMLSDLKGVDKSNLVVNREKKILPEKVLFVHTVGGSAGITTQDVIRDATNVINEADGIAMKLSEKKVGTDEISREELYAVFKHGSLPGYCVFVISPGQTLGYPKGVIEIDYIRMKEVGAEKILEIKYRSNKPFSISMLYTRFPEFRELSGGFYPFTRRVFYAYPIDPTLTGMGLKIGAENADSSWHTTSFELKPSINSVAEMVDVAQDFLEKLDKAWRHNKSKTMFVWNAQNISEESVTIIMERFNESNYKPSIRYLHYGETTLEMAMVAPILDQRIVVIVKEDEKMAGWISICITGTKGGN